MRYDPPFHQTNGIAPTILALAALAVFPLIVDDSYIRHLLILAFIYAIVASSWDLSLGYGGLFNFAHMALFAAGLYTYGILAKTLGISPWLALPLGGVVAVFCAALVAIPVLRLDGIYVILVTLAFSQLLYQIVVSQSEITGGTSGMVLLPSLELGDYNFVRNDRIGYYYTGLALLVVATAFLYKVIRSSLGRAIVAMRDHKYYAVSRGVPEGWTRLLTLTLSAFFTGVAGAFYGSYIRVASPDVFGIGFLTLLLSILLVGGAGTLWGPILGAFVVTLLSEAIADLGAWRNILIALMIILVMVFYPGGLWAMLQELREFIDVRRTAFLVWFRRRRDKSDREALTGTSETMIMTRHGRIAVADTGDDRPTVLLIHGNSACKEAFTRQFSALKDKYRLIAFDLPGHGVSDNADPEMTYNVPAYAEIAEAVLAELGVDRPVVFGWSLGGYVALELAARRNIHPRGLAICGTSPLQIAPDDFAAGYDASSHLVLAGKQYFTRRETRNYAESATAPRSRASSFLHRNLVRTDGRARLYMITKLGVVNWPRQMRMLTEGDLPFAIINGADDPFLNHDYIARLSYGNIFTGAPVTLAGGAHAPFFNTADKFNSIFERFMLEFCEPALRSTAQ